MYPKDLLYSEDHEWIRVDGDTCTLGITQFAQEELGEVVYVELPEPGQSFDAGDEIGTIESVKAVAEVYTPVGGEISEVNSDLEDAPESVNDDPHEGGWLVKMKVASTDALDELMSAEAYQKFLDASKDDD